MITETKFIVGREVRSLTGVYDLDECPIFDRMEEAIEDLISRIDDVEIDVASSLAVLQCEVAKEDVISYEPVQSGLVVQTLLAMQKLKRDLEAAE
jgi:hypothetical protein